MIHEEALYQVYVPLPLPYKFTVLPSFSDGEAATFDGSSRITYDISGPNQWVQTREDYIRLRFKTNQANGLLIFAAGNQGDYIVLEMIRGQLFVNLDLGR